MKFKTFRALAIAGGGAAVLVGALVLGRGCHSGDTDHGSSAAKAAASVQGHAPKGGARKSEAPKDETPKGSAAHASQALRPMDQSILDRARKGISGGKVKDAFPGEAYKVSLYADDRSTVNRLKIDLDRDGKWDEKWTLSSDGGQEKVKRQVAPSDDERYTVEYRLRAGSWVQKE